MPAAAWRSHPAWRLLGRPLLLSVPFAGFFHLTNRGNGFHEFVAYYLVSSIFSLFVNTAVEANIRWVVPRLPRPRGDDESPRYLPLHVASFAVASVVASFLAALGLHFTIMPQMLGSPRAVLTVLVFALVFTALFLGVIYTIVLQRRLMERARNEAERTVRAEQEMRVAAEIQQALLPPRTRSAPWYAAAGASIPCRTIGGDFFEYFDLPDGRVGFALADVAGKGPPAALLAAMVQGILDSHARRGEGPGATLARVNEAIAAREIEARFATVFYAVLGADGRLDYSNAGHNPPLVLRAGREVDRLETGGLMIGPFKGATFEEGSARLEPGDVLVVYSDGVTDAEAPDGDQFGEERLLASATSGSAGDDAEAVRDRLLGAVRAFAADRPLFDDVTVLAVRYLGR